MANSPIRVKIKRGLGSMKENPELEHDEYSADSSFYRPTGPDKLGSLDNLPDPDAFNISVKTFCFLSF